MFNRRFIREKVLQALYAYCQGGSVNAIVCEKNMMHGLRKIYELYIYELSLIVALSDYFQNRFDLAKKKFIPSEKDLNPATHFPKNTVIDQIRNCPRFQLPNSEYKFSWTQQENLLKKMYEEISSAPFYLEYISKTNSFENDKAFLLKVWKKKIATNANFQSLCEDDSIAWASDFDSVSYWVYTSIKEAKEDSDLWIPDNFSCSESGDDEDIAFGKKLLEKTLLHDQEYEPFIFENLKNWESDRVAIMEMLIIKLAVTEFINFPSIPTKVTINEYIELSKRFCSEKSRIFVNGMLNKLCEDLSAKNIIKKSGRGLI